jgi:DNA-binding transcriptional regulator YhcF (GntR family)
MRFWLSRDTSIPLREQLSAQLILGIMSRRLTPGQRLPSVREFARRLQIHANTVSAVYQDLATRGWVTRRAGAGVFVADRAASHPDESVEALARLFVQDGLSRGFSARDLQIAFTSALQTSQARDLLVVDPDSEMAAVIAAEIQEATGHSVVSMALDQALDGLPTARCVLTTEPYAAQVQSLTGQLPFRAVRLKSMQDVIAGHTRPERPVLICVASASESILRWSATLLSALGFPPESSIQRNTTQPDWHNGLRACDIVAVDILTAGKVPSGLPIVVFRIVSDEFLATMRELVTAQEL